MCIVHPLDLESPAVFECAQARCEACLEALLVHHEGLVHAILHRQWRGGLPEADLLQEGRMALWRAIVGFDPHRGVAFSSYAGRAIERQMWRAVFVEGRQRGQHVVQKGIGATCVWSELPNLLEATEEALWWEEVCATLSEMVRRLPDPLQEVVIVSYGLDGGPARSLAALGRWYRVTREMVRVWRNQALVQLRMPIFSARLRVLCGQNSRAAYAQTQALNRAWLGRQRRRKAR